MKIKGFGVKTLEKLEITTITELYHLTKSDLVMSTSDKIGSKLFDEIEKSKGSSFGDFIKSLGINLIGNSAAPKITDCFPDPSATISFEKLRSAGLGEKASKSFMDYYKSTRGVEELELAATQFTFQVKPQGSDTSITTSTYPDLEICITGKLENFSSRTAVTEHLSQFNITVKNSVTKNVKYLICEDESRKNSSSYTKAESKNLPIITINELVQLVSK